MKRLRSKLTYSNVMVTILGFVVLGGGSAYALAGSNTVFSDDIVDNQVKSADVRDDTLTGGGLSAADLQPASVGASEVKPDSLTGARVDESSLGTVPEAAHATNSDQLGGRNANGYQRRVSGSCAAAATIQSIHGDGGVTCHAPTTGVFSIAADLTSNAGQNSKAFSFPPSQLKVNALCAANQVASARFINGGAGGATLNWLFSQGGSTVNASGTALGPFTQGQDSLDFNFTNRVEGQWIFADGAGVTTVNLHGFIAPGNPSSCEFKGTAVYAPRT